MFSFVKKQNSAHKTLPNSFAEWLSFYIPTKNVWMIQFLCIFISIWSYHYFLFYLFWQVCSDMPTVFLICISPEANWCWTSFHVLICHLYILFSEMFVSVSVHFLKNLVVYFLTVELSESFIHFRHTSFVWHLQAPSPGLWLVFSTVSFTEQKLLILMKSSLSIFSFMDHPLLSC